jgi:PKD repeat protein
MNTTRTRSAKLLGVLTSAVLALGFLVPGAAASADTAPPDPGNPASPPTVAADGLPTAQIDGVAWSQVVVGDTVYVAGKFTTARPAGSAPGVNTVPRNNLMAYNINTGVMTSFAPNLNAQALAITASPDGSRIYVVGDFTTVNGAGYYRIAAFSTATGQVIPSFKPILGSQGRAVHATNTTVYIGGTFRTVSGVARDYIAAVNASNGTVVTSFTASADATVNAITLTKDGGKLVVGGRFTNLSGNTSLRGLGAVDPTTGASSGWAASSLVRNAGTQAAIMSLYATSDRVYGSGYVFGAGGNLEGIFSADPATGAIKWIEDCHGDTYAVYTLGDAVYGVGHPHYCGNIGGFPQTDPWTMHYAFAFSKAATGTITPDPYGYFNWAGNPSPTLLNWFPTLVQGSYTGQGQAGWSVTGNDKYVTYAGEFPYVNGVAQYGLVRFAIPSIAPNKIGPTVNAELVPSVASFTAGEVRVSWTATHDHDNANLTYKLVRDGVTASPIYTTNQLSNFYTRPQMGFIDKGLAPGSSHFYRVYVNDPLGNTISRLSPTVTVATADGGGAYEDSVQSDAPKYYWPLDEAGGATAFDHVGFSDLKLAAGVTRGATGPTPPQTASTFSGTSTGFGATPTSEAGPNTFTAEAWIRTNTTRGGKIIGFGNAATGTSGSYDRHIYMDNSGRIYFGVYPGAVRTVNSTATFNDNKWHHVTATLGSGGMVLYVDGKVVGSRTDVTSAQGYTGYWRVGGDNLGSWTNRPSSDYFRGDVAHVAVYSRALAAATVANHFATATSPTPNKSPVAAITSTANKLVASFDGSGSSDPDGTIAGYAWNFGDNTTGSGATPNHTYATGGTYTVTLTVTDNQGATNTVSNPITVSATVAPTASFAATPDDLDVAFDGSASSDPDGTIAGYAWNFGDNTTGTGATPSHSYAAAGTYTVTLTVTDNQGATGTLSQPVSVTAAPVPVTELARDDFERSITGGWGSAVAGGAWTIGGTATPLRVAEGTGQVNLPAGSTRTMTLGSVSSSSADVTVKFSLDTLPTGGGTYATIVGRQSGAANYVANAWVKPTGIVTLVLKQTATTLVTVNVPGITYTPGMQLQMRMQVTDASPTTIQARVWAVGQPEPTTWLLSVTDATAGLQGSGNVGLHYNVTSSSTQPANVRFDDFVAVVAQ